MTAKKKSSKASTLEAKKAIVMKTSKKNPTPIIIAAVVVIAVAAGLGWFLMPVNGPSANTVADAAGQHNRRQRPNHLRSSASLTTARPAILTLSIPKANPPSSISSSKVPMA